MDFKIKTNNVRSFAMQTLTQFTGCTNSLKKIGPVKNIGQILICRTSSKLEDLLLMSPLLKELSNTYPTANIDLFVKGSKATEIFKNYNNIDTVIELPEKSFQQPLEYLKCWGKLRKKKYDLVINADKSSWLGRLAVKFTRARFKLYGDTLSESAALIFSDYKHAAKTSVYDFRFSVSKDGIFEWNEKVPNLDLKLDSSEMSEGNRIFRKIAPAAKKSICIFTYEEGEKRHSAEWWEEFYQKVRGSFPSYALIEILPTEKVSQIGFKAKSFYSSDIRKTASIIANTSIFIGADNGIMQLASAAKVPVLGLFITDPERYAPYNNYSSAIETNEDSIDNIVELIDTILHHRLN
ncbi:glycosyltransferase family 9 protein [Flavobacterium sp. SH_e]|uniref:glycosyltransferase family 9 protein n=1 Tax=Flavobacterium sp. SH_e TaxID=2983767 RepID=UPI0021E4D7D5|nr:glycosyltransferase family 9 protein [Flavobacterium sp. SH_e]MCV2487518.1 glycosyltransferase family 9 protein [Flavobacterium sp. SH_e]